VDDIFQETMLIAWRCFEDYDATHLLGAWVRGIAHKLICGPGKSILLQKLGFIMLPIIIVCHLIY
jgi:hypothetical protein